LHETNFLQLVSSVCASANSFVGLIWDRR